MSQDINQLPLVRLEEAPEIFIDGYHGVAKTTAL
jgi:hypothetical protein